MMDFHPPVIDFHSHILPDMDDGSRSVDESVEMLHMENAQKVGQVVLTPHFYADKDSVETFLARRADRLERLRRIQETDAAIPRLHAGAEVYYFPGMGRAELLPRLCIGDTRVILLELPFCQWNEEILRDVEMIIGKQKLTVVLAHVERYTEFQKRWDVWDRLFQFPLCAQINAGSFLKRKKRKRALRLLEEIPKVILGSDCHNLESRPPNLAEGRAVIRQKAGEERLSGIDELGKRFLQE